MSIRNASSSGRFARARTRCSIEISLSYSVASNPFRYAGQTASNAASHALASGGLRSSVPAKCLSRKHSWQIGCQMIENECFPAICRARSISWRYLALDRGPSADIASRTSPARRRFAAVPAPPCLQSSRHRRPSSTAALHIPSRYRNRNALSIGQAVEPPHIPQLALAFARNEDRPLDPPVRPPTQSSAPRRTRQPGSSRRCCSPA